MKAFEPDTIIALGGGSPMDAAKVMWLFYEQPEIDFRDLVQKFMDIRKRAFRFPSLGKLSLIHICGRYVRTLPHPERLYHADTDWARGDSQSL